LDRKKSPPKRAKWQELARQGIWRQGALAEIGAMSLAAVSTAYAEDTPAAPI
jgi:hypothetical protein